jgi:hypothetical protein
MIDNSSGGAWAEQVFGACDLGDPRRRQRLIEFAGRQADNPSGSIPQVCKGDKAAQEGAYRMIRNPAVLPEDIAEGVFKHSARRAASCTTCLAIQDSTSVSFAQDVGTREEDQGSPTGFMVHSTLLFDPIAQQLIGLIAQERWIRDEKSKRPGKKTRRIRPYREKESFKWEYASEQMSQRLRSMENIVTVCDREADIFEFLQYEQRNGYRHVVRAAQNRHLSIEQGYLLSHMQNQPVLGRRSVVISQRGGQRGSLTQQARPARKGRVAELELRSARVTLRAPVNRPIDGRHDVELNVVYATEPNPPAEKEPICWMLLTTEPVMTLSDTNRVMDYYVMRWLIEEFHKSWKTGCRIQERPLQAANRERMMVITAAIAVRILQMKYIVECQDDDTSCETVLTRDEWQCLYAVTMKDSPMPDKPPSMKWAYYTIAKTAGWTDTKQTGRVGWQTLWKGWEILQAQLLAWNAAKAHRG